MKILLTGKPLKNKAHGAEVGVRYALENLGHEVDIFDYDKSKYIDTNTNYDIVLSMGAGIPPKMLKENHNLTTVLKNNISVLWNSEPIRLSNYYKRVNSQKHLYDIHATFDASEVKIYTAMGCNAMFLPQAGHPLWYRPLDIKPKKFACFVGSIGGKWENRVHFLNRVKDIIPSKELTITSTFDAQQVNEIYNTHYLVLNLGLYHKELGPPTRMASFGYQQRIFEAYCSCVPCFTNVPNSQDEETLDLFTPNKDIILYNNETMEPMLKYYYNNREKLLEIKENMAKNKGCNTYTQRLGLFFEKLKGIV